MRTARSSASIESSAAVARLARRVPCVALPPDTSGEGFARAQPLWISSEWAVGPISVRYSVWTCVYRGTCASHTVACVPLCVCDCVVCACVCVSLSGGGGRAPLPVFIRRDSKQLTIKQKLCVCVWARTVDSRGVRAHAHAPSGLGSCSSVAVGEEGVRPMCFP